VLEWLSMLKRTGHVEIAFGGVEAHAHGADEHGIEPGEFGHDVESAHRAIGSPLTRRAFLQVAQGTRIAECWLHSVRV
jgi:hypothetical protein